MRILFITTEWPTKKRPADVPFLVSYRDALQAVGVEIDLFHFRGEGNPFNYLKAWLRVRKTQAWKKADLLHAHWGQSAFLGLCSSKPLVITYHGSDLMGIPNSNGQNTLKGQLMVAFSKWVARHANYCIAVSEHLNSLLPEGINSQVIPMGVDLELFKPMDKEICRERLKLDLGKFLILFVSNPARPEKRYGLAQKAVSALMLQQPQKTIELIAVYNQSIKMVPLYLNAVDVLLLTSFHEGSPVIIKEALACNLPIVATDVGDVRERIEQIEGCHVCEDDSVETLTQKLSLTLASSERINGRASIQHLSWQSVAEKTKSLYDQILLK